MLGATQITYYFSVHYLQSESHSFDTGPLCICLPALSLNSTPPPQLLSSLLNTFGTILPLWLKNINVSVVAFFPLRLSLWFSFGKKRLLRGHVRCPHENLRLYFQKRPLCSNYTFSQLIFQLRCLVQNHLGNDRAPTCS